MDLWPGSNGEGGGAVYFLGLCNHEFGYMIWFGMASWIKWVGTHRFASLRLLTPFGGLKH